MALSYVGVDQADDRHHLLVTKPCLYYMYEQLPLARVWDASASAEFVVAVLVVVERQAKCRLTMATRSLLGES